jgi:chromate reductase
MPPARKPMRFTTTKVPMMPQPEAYVGGAAALFDAAGNVTNERTRGFFKTFMDAFTAWVEANAPR